MDETSIREHITRTFVGVDVVDAMGASFFFLMTRITCFRSRQSSLPTSTTRPPTSLAQASSV